LRRFLPKFVVDFGEQGLDRQYAENKGKTCKKREANLIEDNDDYNDNLWGAHKQIGHKKNGFFNSVSVIG